MSPRKSGTIHVERPKSTFRNMRRLCVTSVILCPRKRHCKLRRRFGPLYARRICLLHRIEPSEQFAGAARCPKTIEELPKSIPYYFLLGSKVQSAHSRSLPELHRHCSTRTPARSPSPPAALLGCPRRSWATQKCLPREKTG